MLEQIVKDITETVKESVLKGIATISEKFEPRIQALEDSLKNLPTPKDGEPGKDGRDGIDGKDGEPGKDGVDGKDGIDGKDGNPGSDGKNGVDGKDGEPGKDGRDGVDGKDVDIEEVKHLLEGLVKDLPVPKDGIDGKDAEPVDIEGIKKEIAEAFVNEAESMKTLILDTIKQLPVPKDGEPGKDAEPVDVEKISQQIKDSVLDSVSSAISAIEQDVEKQIAKAVENIPVPKDGKDADPVDVNSIVSLLSKQVDQLVSTKVAELSAHTVECIEKTFRDTPKPKDGKDAEPIDMAQVKAMLSELVERAVEKIEVPRPRDGENGRDAIAIDILPSIDESKVYDRNTYASHNGGLWRSFERTKGMRGWECIVDGVRDITVDYDGERELKVFTARSSGEIVEKSFTLPVMIYKEVYREGNSYRKGDTVTWAGSTWTCMKDTAEKPGSNEDWRLSVKAGRNASTPVKIGAQ